MSRFPQETVWSSNLILASRAWPHCLSSCTFPPWRGCVNDRLLPVEASSQWGLSADVPLNELCHHWVSWNLTFFTCELWVYALCFFKDLKNMYIVLSTCYIWQTLLGFSLFPFQKNPEAIWVTVVPRARGLVMTDHDNFIFHRHDWFGGKKFSSSQWYERGSLLELPGEIVHPEKTDGWEGTFSLLLANLSVKKQDWGSNLGAGWVLMLSWSNHGTASSSILFKNNKYV